MILKISGTEFQSTLQLVEIYFDTATFDDIERDKKIKTEAQLSLIGGTMGLLTGFSIISGVEIIFFLIRSLSLFPLIPNIYSTNNGKTSEESHGASNETQLGLRLYLLVSLDVVKGGRVKVDLHQLES